MRKIFSAAVLAAAVLAVAACGSSTSSSGSAPTSSAPGAGSSSSSSSGTTLKTATINGTTVLTNAAGFTLYTFAIDTSTASKCTGSCVTYWPPVKGPATAGSGVSGTVGTITRSDGTTQVTYDGHPLYTYVGDSAPGQNKGNGLNLSGGLWYEATPSGSTPATGSSASSSPSSGGGGYGY
jgi:predicted lipoprotein with Yx(FWY)xxD motif